MRHNIRKIRFNEEMEKDFEFIKTQFKDRFNIKPSNKSLMELLLETYKNTKISVSKTPNKKKEFKVRL